MIRFIMRRKWKDAASNCEGQSLYTIDGDVGQVERELRNGGYSQYGYEYRELVGVEVVNNWVEAPEPAKTEAKEARGR